MRKETLNRVAVPAGRMELSVEVVGEGTRAVDLDDAATYADVLRAVDLSPHEATVLVDGTPVPEDRPVDPGGAESVTVLRLIKGGSGGGRRLDLGGSTTGRPNPTAHGGSTRRVPTGE